MSEITERINKAEELSQAYNKQNKILWGQLSAQVGATKEWRDKCFELEEKLKQKEEEVKKLQLRRLTVNPNFVEQIQN